MGVDDKTIRIWDVETGKVLKIFDDRNDHVKSVAFCNNDDKMVSGSG